MDKIITISKYKDFIITGERLQQKCDIYIGNSNKFRYMRELDSFTQKSKFIDINHFLQNQSPFSNSNNYVYDNPRYIFCYNDFIKDLSKKIKFFKNEFILISHNSDINIFALDFIIDILNCDKLIKWYCQNICFIHPKLHLLPIGLANSIWPHGDLSIFDDLNVINNLHIKTREIYFNFNISTNPSKRILCYESLKNKIEWLNNINPKSNLYRLKDYKFCICPEGNGVDTHRLWESLYLKVVPIVLKSDFTSILLKYKIPLVILNNWTDLDISLLNYNNYYNLFISDDFKNIAYLDRLSEYIFK